MAPTVHTKVRHIHAKSTIQQPLSCLAAYTLPDNSPTHSPSPSDNEVAHCHPHEAEQQLPKFILRWWKRVDDLAKYDTDQSCQDLY